MASWKTEKALANYARKMNVDMEVSPDGSGLTAVLPGVDINMLDKDGNPCSWAIFKEGQVVRFIGLRYPNFFINPLENHTKGTVGMMIASRLHLSPALYTDSKLNYPMELSVRISAIGTAAVAFVESLRHQHTQAVLFEALMVIVNVNTSTRKPSPLDAEFVERYSPSCRRNAALPRIESPLKPSSAPGQRDLQVSHCQRQAVRSDLDHLNHVNQSNYLKFCLDAASLSVKDDPQSSASLVVKQADSVHKGEVREGDVMDIYTWKAEAAADVLHFQIEVQAKVVYNATVQFYPKDAYIYSKL